MNIFNPNIPKYQVWEKIVSDLGLHSPAVKDDSPRKQHTSGRRESRTQLREPEKGRYRQTERGYLVRA